MKKIVLIMMICLPMMVMAQKKVAVYVTSDDNGIDNTTKGIIGGELVRAIVKTQKYQAVERTADFLKQINKEQEYQHSGTVDDEQISALGKQFGVDYVCVANVMPFRDKVYMQARLIDVETATVLAIARETSSMSDIEEIIAASEVVANVLINPDGTSMSHTEKTTKRNEQTQESDMYEQITNEGEIIHYSAKERKKGGHLEYSCGGVEMNSKDLMVYLSKTCTPAYSQYNIGRNCIITGWVLLGVGVSTTVSGLFFNFTAMGMGIGMVVGSCVTLPLGYVYKKNAINTYNQNCARKQKVACSFNLKSNSDGFGLALTF